MKIPTMYWLLKLHKLLYKYIFISSSSNCSTITLSIFVTKLKKIVEFNYIWNIKNSLEVLDKLHARLFNVLIFQLNTLPHNLIKKNYLIKWSFLIHKDVCDMAYTVITHTARKARYSPNKLTKPLNRFVRKGYTCS